jgi:pimeloyl-ACP methyl ester carboxylesterase
VTGDGPSTGMRAAGWLISQPARDGYSGAMAYFRYDGQRLAYTVYGRGPRVTILLPGLLLSQKMQARLAQALAARGNRVITFDPLGHGDSDRPRDMWRYSMPAFAQQTVGLLDHLELERAIVGGTSLGANITLEVASLAPDRLRGMILEMPVLDNAIPACAAAFTPVLFALTFGEPVMRAVAFISRVAPRRGVPFLLQIGLDWLAQDPGPSGAVLQGIIFGRTAPHRTERRLFDAPALVIGHPRDPVHPFSDADMLAAELPNARLIDADSIIELRLRPDRLTNKIAQFVDECWGGTAAAASAPQASADGASAQGASAGGAGARTRRRRAAAG